MIIIYHGKGGYLPQIACQIHLSHHGRRVNNYPEAIGSPCMSAAFFSAGVDASDNIICYLVTGAASDIYRRAIQGIGQIFKVDIILVDVDRLCALSDCGGVIKFLAKWFPGMFKPYFEKQMNKVIKSNTLGQRQGDSN